MAEPILATTGLEKHFGGVYATQNVNLAVLPGEIHAVIGPNGAGKTTLISLLAGELVPNGGQIVFAGEDVTGLGVHQRAQRGLGRTFQINNLFPGFSVRDNVLLAIQAQRGSNFRFWRDAHRIDDHVARAEQVLADLGMDDAFDAPVTELSYGQQRLVEIAIALAGEPKLLLLDEPLAGLDAGGGQAMVATLQRLCQRCTLVLVEHDMDAVFALAHRITVLANGQVLATGAPDGVRNDPQVREAYLGYHGEEQG